MKNNRNIKSTKKVSLLIFIIVFSITFCLILGEVYPFFNSTADALNGTNMDNAIKVGDSVSLWDSETSTINKTVFDDLIDKLFNGLDPINYIKSNGTHDYETYGKNSPSSAAGTPYYVVPAPTINANVGRPNDGMVIKIGAQLWMITSLTIAVIDGKENVVATIYQGNTPGDGSAFWSDGANTKGNSSYSRSLLRNNLLTRDEFKTFSDGSSANSFARRFLVQPQYIKYQETETQIGRPTSLSSQVHLPNEAYGQFTGGWGSNVNYQPADKFNDSTGKTVYYDDWKYDYIWIPSLTEAGLIDYWKTSSIWRLTANQLIHTANTGLSWSRSGHDINYCSAYAISANGTFGTNIFGTRNVRPAMHLNLTAIASSLGVVLDNPENVTSTYNGDVQTVKSAVGENSTAYPWYETEWYEHTGNYVNLTYQDLQGAAVTNIKNAGEYWVKAEITDNWINAVNAEVEADGVKYGWTATQIAEAKQNRKPKFAGDPVTESGHVETDTVRWFKFTIKPKELTVNKPSYNASTGDYTAPSFASGSAPYGGDTVTLATQYTGTAADGTVFDQIDTVPNKRGTYTAQAILVNSATDKTEYTGGNYVIANASSMNCQVQINRQRLDIPRASEGNKQYTGEQIKFILSGYTAEWRETATLILPADGGITLEGDDVNGWYLVVAKDAGTYTVSAALNADKKSDWCWNTGKPSEESTEDKAITVTVTRKTLFVDFLSTSGGFLMQKGAEVKFSAEASNGIEGDTIKITLEYYKSDNASVGIPVPSGVLDASTLDSGTYRLIAKIEDAVAADNKNYELDASSAYQDFTISAQSINIETVGWQYTQNNGLAQPISGGASKDAPAIVVYNGSTFVFALSDNANALHSKGVKVDTTYGVNGYENGLQLNATLDPVAVTVRLIPYNAEYAFNDENGKPLKEQHKDFTIYVSVDPAEIDFSQLKWSADELEYTAMAQQVVVESGLPSFLRVGYAGNSAWDIGEYQAKIVSLMITDFEAAANYNVPSVLDSIPTHTWKIIKRRIPIKWVMTEEEGQDNEIIFVPSLSDDAEGAIEYVYYGSTDDVVPVPDKTKEMTLEEICKAYDQTTYKTYYVFARLKAPSETEVRSFSSKNCVLLERKEEKTESYQGFSIGGNKNPVRVSLKKDVVVYNGTEQPAEVEIDAGGLRVEYKITYMVKNEAGEYEKFSGIPNDAGEYQVVVEISKAQSGDFAVAGGRYIDYVIEKASFDLSGYKWLDTLNENKEYTGPYTYNPNITHKLEYIGEGVEGIRVSCTAVEGTDAGEYKVLVSFAYTDETLYGMNYNKPEDFEYTWEIEKCAPDLSGVVWNCNEEPFVFAIVDGEAVKYKAELKFPEGLEHLGRLIVYEGDNGEYSDAGFHTTSFRLTEDEELLKNYGDIEFSALLDREIEWEIAPLRVPKAEQIQDKVVYRAGGYSLKEITNLPEDFTQYFEVKVYDGSNKEIAAQDGTWQFVNIGRYKIQILFKRGMNKSNGGTVDNVKWSDNSRGPYQVVLTVNKLVFEIDGWTNGEGTERPTLNAEELDELEKYFDYILKKQETGEIIAIDETLEMATLYSIWVKLKEGHSGNVALKYKGTETELEETEPYVFETEDPFTQPPTDFYERPEDVTLRYEYTGEEITFRLEDLEWYEPAEMEVKSGELKGTEKGEYEVTVGFVSGSLYAWGTADEWDRTPVTVKIEIYEDEEKDRFILTEAAAASHGYKFLYVSFKAYEKDIREYVYSAGDEESTVYMANLAFEDTIADLLRQFANAEDITAYGADGTKIEDHTTVLATGMMLRIMEGESVLNQLTISVMGDIDGDGEIGTADKARLNSYTLDNLDLHGAYLLACDLDGDGEIGTADKARLNAYTLDTLDIYAGLTLRDAAQATAKVSGEAVNLVSAAKEEKVSAIVPTYATAEDAVTVGTATVPERDSDEADEANSIMITYTAAEALNNCGTSVNIAVKETIFETAITYAIDETSTALWRRSYMRKI